MTIRHVIFDLFNTLGQRDETHYTPLVQEFWSVNQARWDVEDIDSEEVLMAFAKSRKIAYETIQKEWNQWCSSMHFFPGIQEMLQKIHDAGYQLHLLSDTGKHIMDFVEKEQDVFSLFTSITFSYHLRYAKPDLRVFRAVFRKTGAMPDECVMIGDSVEHDIVPAQTLGMQTLLFDGRKQNVASVLTTLGIE